MMLLSTLRGPFAGAALLAALAAAPTQATAKDAMAKEAMAKTTPASATAVDTAAMPDEAMTATFVGSWKGRGEVLPKIGQKRPFRVTCDFELTNTGASMNIDGECGALFVKRGVTVDLTLKDGEATGTYDASLRTGIAQLSGRRDGNVIDLEIRWNGEVNGDLTAEMRIEAETSDKMRLLITDKDPETGESVQTTDITLERA